MLRIWNSLLLLLAFGMMSGCSLLQKPTGDGSTVLAIDSQEATVVTPDAAEMMVNDVMQDLRQAYPPAQTAFIFVPPYEVFGLDLQDRLRAAGYGLSNSRLGNGENLTLRYVLDSLGEGYRLSVKVADVWETHRLYHYQDGRLAAFASTQRGGITTKKNNRAEVSAGNLGGKVSRGQVVPTAYKPLLPPKTVSLQPARMRSQPRMAFFRDERQVVSAADWVAVPPVLVAENPDSNLATEAWFVQVLAGTEMDDFERKRQSIEWPTVLVPLKRPGFYALRVGGYDDKSSAQVARKALRVRFSDAFLVKAGGGQS